MALYEMTSNGLEALAGTTFAEAGVHERADLQRRLRENVEIISPDTKVIAEEFGDFEGASRRIDLLGVDSDGNLVVIELKRTETGGHMELQAVRYAAMVSTMTFDRAVDVYRGFLKSQGDTETDAESDLREFLGYDEGDEGIEDSFAQAVRIVLASGEFGVELTTAVLWLNEQGLDIRCVRLRPYRDNGRVLIDVQQVVPLPEAEDYQVKLREKEQKERTGRKSGKKRQRYDVSIGGEVTPDLPKRQMMLTAVHGLSAKGVTPQMMIEAVTFRKTNSFLCAAGEHHDEASFMKAAQRDAEEAGTKIDPKRWFTHDEALIRSQGATFAVSNQWGKRAEKWLGEIFEKHPNTGVSIRAADK